MNTLMVAAIASYTDGPMGGIDGEWWWILRPLIVLLWVLVIAFVVRWVFRFPGRRGPSPLERARDILAERYARGEISSEEYGERLERLR